MLKEYSASSRMSFKQIVGNKDVFYTFEYSETHTMPDGATEEEIKKAKADLWNKVNGEVDKQYLEVKELYKKRGEN